MWYQDDMPHPQLPPATSYGWKKEGDRLDCQSQQRILQLQMQLLTSSSVGVRKQDAGRIVPAGPSASTAQRCVRVELTKICAVTSVRHYWGIEEDEEDGDPSI